MNFNTRTGVPVKLDGSEEVAFYINANNMGFMERSIELYKEMESFEVKLKEKMDSIDLKVDENGVPENFEEIIQIMKFSFNSVLDKLDFLFGEKVSDKIFKGEVNFTLLENFMKFLTDTIQSERKSGVSKYTENRAQKRNKKKVMN